MGAPKATATPAAHAALRISLLLPSFRSNLLKSRVRMLPMQDAMWTKGPSLPSVKPDATLNARPMPLVTRVHEPR